MNIGNVPCEPSPLKPLHPSLPPSSSFQSESANSFPEVYQKVSHPNNVVERKTIKIRRPGSGEPISASPMKKIIRPRSGEPVSASPLKTIKRSKSVHLTSTSLVKKIGYPRGGELMSASLVKKQTIKHRSETEDIPSILEYLNVEEDDYLNKILLKKNINSLIIHVGELCKDNANNPIKESEFKSLSYVLQKVRKNMGLSVDDALVMFQEQIPNKVYDLLKRLVTEDKKQYKSLLRTFSLSIHFYSPLAYNFLRRRLGDGVPHPRTIQSWYSTIDKYMH